MPRRISNEVRWSRADRAEIRVPGPCSPGVDQGPQGFEKTVAFALDEWPAIALPCAESGRRGRDAGTGEGRQEDAPPQLRGTGADHRGDEEPVGGGEEGQGGGEISRAEDGGAENGCEGAGGQTNSEAHCPENRRQESKAGGRAAEGGWPWRSPAELSTLRRIFVHFPQVPLAALDLAILFRPFGGKVFDRLGGHTRR